MLSQRLFQISIVISLLSPQSLFAGAIYDCRIAIALNDKYAAEEPARQLKSPDYAKSIFPLSDRDLATAIECLRLATGELYVVDLENGLFFSAQDALSLPKDKEAARKQIIQKREEEQNDRKNPITADEQKEKDASKEKVKIYKGTIAACNDLYNQQPKDAIINPLCMETFREIGFPE